MSVKVQPHDPQCDYLNRGLQCNCRALREGVLIAHRKSRYGELDRAGQVAHDLERSGGNTAHAVGPWRDCNSQTCIDYILEIHTTLEAEAVAAERDVPDPTKSYVAPMRVQIDTPDFRRGYMALIARDGNGTTLLTADEARTLARRLDSAARELER